MKTYYNCRIWCYGYYPFAVHTIALPDRTCHVDHLPGAKQSALRYNMRFSAIATDINDNVYHIYRNRRINYAVAIPVKGDL